MSNNNPQPAPSPPPTPPLPFHSLVASAIPQAPASTENTELKAKQDREDLKLQPLLLEAFEAHDSFNPFSEAISLYKRAEDEHLQWSILQDLMGYTKPKKQHKKEQQEQAPQQPTVIINQLYAETIPRPQFP